MAKRKLSRTDTRTSGGAAERRSSSKSTDKKTSSRSSSSDDKRRERPSNKFSDKPFERKRPSSKFGREESSDRPKRSFSRGDSPSGERKKPFSGGERRSSRPDGFRANADSKPRRGYPDGFKREEGNSEDRPKRPLRFSGDSSSRSTSFNRDAGSGFDKRKSFGDREERSERPKRPFRSGDSPRGDSFKRDSDRPFTKRPFDKEGDRPKRSLPTRQAGFSGDRDERPKRPFSKDADKPFERKRPFDRDEKPARGFSGDAEPTSRRPFSRDTEKPFERKRPFDRDEKPKRDFSADREERPRRSFKSDREEIPNDVSKSDEKPFARKRPFEDREVKSDSREKRPRKSFTESKSFSSKGYTRADDAGAKPGKMRLNRYLANSGISSRREADEFIKMGLVTVNGTTITEMGYQVQPGDVVKYEGKMLRAEKPVYILMNKPKGFLTTTRDPEDRNTVMEIIGSAVKERIYPVGRLDRNTTGLLLLTNDGALTEQLSHPSYNVKKIYKVELDRPLAKVDFEKIGQGVYLEEGRAMVDDIAIVSDDGKTVGIEIHIGWNRVVRRIFESLEYQVVKLDRTIYAGLDKKELARGQWRFLKEEEVVRLKHLKKGT
jgi:23S rRNA pseudouridine2605 synthase